MGNVGVLVETASESMTDVFFDNGEATAMGKGDDGIPDGADGAAWGEGGDGCKEGVESALGDGSSIIGGLADEEGFGLIAVPAIDDGRNVDVDDIAFFESIIAGDPVADDFIDAGAAALGVAEVAFGGGDVTGGDGEIVDEGIDFGGGDTGFDEAAYIVHEAGIEFSSHAHRIPLAMTELEFAVVLKHVHSRRVATCGSSWGREVERQDRARNLKVYTAICGDPIAGGGYFLGSEGR